MTGRSIWLPRGAWPARNRKCHFGLYLPVSSEDHDGPERPLEVHIHGELRKLGIAVAQSNDGSIFASASETALPDLANVSDQSSDRNCGHRLFHRANGDPLDFFVFVVLSHHRRRVLHFGWVTEHPGSGWFCTPFAHISRTLTFLRFLFLAATNLLFSLQASVAHARQYEPKNKVEHSH